MSGRGSQADGALVAALPAEGKSAKDARELLRFVQPGKIGGLGRVPAPSMRATAPDRLRTGASQTIGKWLVAVPVGAGVVPAFMPKQSATPS